MVTDAEWRSSGALDSGFVNLFLGVATVFCIACAALVNFYFPTLLFDLLGVPLGLRTVILVVLVFMGAAILGRGSVAHLKKSDWHVIAILGVCALYLVLRTSVDITYSREKLLRCLAIPIAFSMFAIYLFRLNPRRFESSFVKSIAAIGYGSCAVLLVAPEMFVYELHQVRYQVGIVNPIWVGRAIAAALLLTVVYAPFPVVVKGAIGLVLLLGIGLTGSRGPLWGGVLVIAFALVARFSFGTVEERRRAGPMILAALICVLVSASAVSMWDPGAGGALARLATLVEASSRIELFESALSQGASAPVFGNGLGLFRSPFPPSPLLLGLSSEGYYAHNIILEVWCELGFIGLVLLCVAIWPKAFLRSLLGPLGGLFVLFLVFAMTSGDIYGNAGVFILGSVLRLSRT